MSTAFSPVSSTSPLQMMAPSSILTEGWVRTTITSLSPLIGIKSLPWSSVSREAGDLVAAIRLAPPERRPVLLGLVQSSLLGKVLDVTRGAVVERGEPLVQVVNALRRQGAVRR